jgi:hypothetical protein
MRLILWVALMGAAACSSGTGSDMAPNNLADLSGVDLSSHKSPCSFEWVQCGTDHCYTCYLGVTPNICAQSCSLAAPNCPVGQTCRPTSGAFVGGFGGAADCGDGYCL